MLTVGASVQAPQRLLVTLAKAPTTTHFRGSTFQQTTFGHRDASSLLNRLHQQRMGMESPFFGELSLLRRRLFKRSRRDLIEGGKYSLAQSWNQLAAPLRVDIRIAATHTLAWQMGDEHLWIPPLFPQLAGVLGEDGKLLHWGVKTLDELARGPFKLTSIFPHISHAFDVGEDNFSYMLDKVNTKRQMKDLEDWAKRFFVAALAVAFSDPTGPDEIRDQMEMQSEFLLGAATLLERYYLENEQITSEIGLVWDLRVKDIATTPLEERAGVLAMMQEKLGEQVETYVGGLGRREEHRKKRALAARLFADAAANWHLKATQFPGNKPTVALRRRERNLKKSLGILFGQT